MELAAKWEGRSPWEIGAPGSRGGAAAAGTAGGGAGRGRPLGQLRAAAGDRRARRRACSGRSTRPPARCPGARPGRCARSIACVGCSGVVGCRRPAAARRSDRRRPTPTRPARGESARARRPTGPARPRAVPAAATALGQLRTRSSRAFAATPLLARAAAPAAPRSRRAARARRRCAQRDWPRARRSADRRSSGSSSAGDRVGPRSVALPDDTEAEEGRYDREPHRRRAR